jgi:putative ABC transport system ATP-binding protein
MSLISLMDVSKQFKDDERVFNILENVNLNIEEHTISIILGSSGSGKTTLLNIIDGIESITSGSLTKKENLKVGYVTQYANYIDELTVEQNLMLSIYNQKEKANIRDLCELFDCTYLLRKKPSHLSGGEKQRINIVRTLLMKPELIILDEPTASLDHDNKFKVISFLQTIFDEGNITFIIVSHDQEVVDYFKNKNVYRLKSKTLLHER